jgi:hypothetical protein
MLCFITTGTTDQVQIWVCLLQVILVSFNRILGKEGIFDQYRRTRYYEKPHQVMQNEAGEGVMINRINSGLLYDIYHTKILQVK